ncbi:MAG TPA: hypothetical protein VFQ53_21060 [Kofleriaceae bacterium]|nr:hypothetical protein [Kofleriaceae bacterium]
MKDDLGSASRALLDAAREGLSPDAAAIARMRSRIDAAVVTAGAGTATAATTTLATKLGLVGITLALVAGAVLYARREHTAVAAIAPPALEIDHVVAPPTPALHASAHDDPAPPPARVVEPHASAIAPRATIDLGREVALIDRAMAAMQSGDPSAALVAVHVHARETAGHGQLAEDAAAIEIEALCRLHDPTTADKLAAFDVRWPESAQRSRLSARCP